MSRLITFSLKTSVLIGGCLIATQLFAGGAETVTPAADFLPAPGVSVYGMGGNGWTAIADAMAPLCGQSMQFLYIDPQFYYHSQNSYAGSIGAGLRRLTGRAGILGAYVFGDYNRSTDGHNFWFVSPGIERLGQILDFSANGYIPVSSQRINTGLEFADQIGDTSQVKFSGHTQYDALVNTFTSIGYGGDAQVGVHLPFLMNSEIYFGGYYFAPKDTSTIGGGAVRLQAPINRYINVLFSEAYDSQYHNTVKAGLTLWFGGRHTDDGLHGNLVERMVDPVQRNLVIVAGGSRTAQPAVTDYADTGQRAIELENISFFVPESSPVITADAATASGDGTYENPYVGMSQANVDNANAQKNRNFYIDSGVYNAVYGVTDPNYIVLNNDQLYGRQNDFTQTAKDAARPLIQFSNGGFEIPADDSKDTLNDLQLAGPNTDGHGGIWINHTDGFLDQTVIINNTSIQSFGDGIDILNNSNSTLTVTANNSWIVNNNGAGELFDTFQTLGGIAAVNTGAGALQLNLNHSSISHNTKLVDYPSLIAVGGLALVNENNGAMIVQVNHSLFSKNTVAIDHNSNEVSRIGAAGALAAVNTGNGTMTIKTDYSTFSDNTIAISENSEQLVVLQAAGGLVALNESLGTVLVDVDHSSLSENNFSMNNLSNFSQIQVDAMGGLASDNIDAGVMTVNVKHSTLSENTVAVNSGNAPGNFIKVMGGLAAINNESTGATTIYVDDSIFSGNTFAFNGSGAIASNAIGGLAASNEGFEGAIMTVNVSHSTINENTIVSDMSSGDSEIPGETFNTLGGLAVSNLGHDSTLIVDVSDSNISHNTVSMNNNVTGLSIYDMYAIGGMAVASNDGTTTVDISHSTISGNTIDFNNSVMVEEVEAAGGLALASNINQQDGSLTVNVSHSNIAQNAVSFNDQAELANIYTAGGLAAFGSANGSMTLNVEYSTIAKNVVSFNDSGGTIYSAGGLAVTDFDESGTTGVNISHSTISENTATFGDGSQTSGASGGLAITSNYFPLVVNVNTSTITGNSPGGIDLSGGNNVSMTVNHSIIAENTDFGISANNGATIDVTNPIFFDGIVNAGSGSVITFQGLSSPITTDGIHVICLPLTPCKIV